MALVPLAFDEHNGTLAMRALRIFFGKRSRLSSISTRIPLSFKRSSTPRRHSLYSSATRTPSTSTGTKPREDHHGADHARRGANESLPSHDPILGHAEVRRCKNRPLLLLAGPQSIGGANMLACPSGDNR